MIINNGKKNIGVLTTDVHLIGHSLGAQTCGYAGKSIPNLGRITGNTENESILVYKLWI